MGNSATSVTVPGGYRLATDVGGTFVDFVLLDEATGEITVDKEPAFRDEVADRLFMGYERIAAGRSVNRLIHGSTLAINTILQEAGSPVGLITNVGFRDVLEIGRGNRTDIYDFLWQPASPLVARRLRREVAGRMSFDGAELAPLSDEDVLREAAFLVGEGVEAVAICFLHSYANPAHERRARDLVAEYWPTLLLTSSHEVATEWREFERTSSVVLNAYVMPIVAGYLDDVEGRLAEHDFRGSFAVMQSNGGVMAPSVAKRVPIRTLESGPAGGVVGAHALAAALGLTNVICADVGGTSFDVSLIHEGRFIERFRTDVAGRPVIAPTVDITSIGAGGGSIGWVDDRGALRVGPESAGSRPGPACFGFGGSRPTVTDAHLIVGRFDPDRFLGSRMRLDRTAAEEAIGSVASALGLTVDAAAAGILRIAETNMVYAIRQITVERGYDPREFTLLAYGGGGGLFAAAIARELEIPRVVIPRADAVFSAWGLLFADYREDASMTRVLDVDEDDDRDFRAKLDQVTAEALALLGHHGVDQATVATFALADVRFKGQEHTLTVSVPADPDGSTTACLKRGFVERHQAHYGQADPTRPIQITTLRATAIGRVAHPTLQTITAPSQEASPRENRPVWFSDVDATVETAVWERASLAPGQTIRGPAIVEEWSSTVLVEPEQSAYRDAFGNVILDLGGHS